MEGVRTVCDMSEHDSEIKIIYQSVMLGGGGGSDGNSMEELFRSTEVFFWVSGSIESPR